MKKSKIITIIAGTLSLGTIVGYMEKKSAILVKRKMNLYAYLINRDFMKNI